MSKTKKRKAPVKKCKECGKMSHARTATCQCGYVFYQKKQRNKAIENWQDLRRGDLVKSVKGHGPYWIHPETQEKTYMGSYGKFSVQDVGRDYIVVHERAGSHKYGSGTIILYMGDHVKSLLCDNMYRCPHKLVRV